MKLLSLILPCMLAATPVCEFQGSGFLIDEWKISQVYVCSQNQSEYKEDVIIKVKTGAEEICIVPTVNYGYDPSVFLGDFVGNGLSQIFYSVNSGGSGAYSSSQIISLQGGESKTVFDSEKFKNSAVGTLEDDIVKIEYQNQNYFIDVSQADLSGEKEVYISDVNTVMPIYNGGLGKYQIMQLQKVYIDYTANNVGYLASIIDLTLDGGKIVSVGTFSNFDY